MIPLLTNTEMKEAESAFIQSTGISDLVLMEHAALALLHALENRFGNLTEFQGCILSGVGNNGGDGIALARLLLQRKIPHALIVIGPESKLSKSAALQLKIYQKLGGSFSSDLSDATLKKSDWIVDALFGTGLSKEVGDPYRSLIGKVNQVSGQKWILAADIPSGLNGDTGNELGCAIQASHTVSFGFLKRGLVTGKAADFVGKLTLDAVEIPRELPLPIETFLWDKADATRISARKSASHKGDYGHVYVCLGEAEKEGASLLACLGALKSGAGLVTLLGSERALSQVKPRLLPEIMTASIDSARIGVGVCVVGPGFGTGTSQWKLLTSLLKGEGTLVLDADAITLIAEHAEEGGALLKERKERKLSTLLTPHPKEASRLLKTTVDEIQTDRYQSIKRLVEKTHAWVLLKGKGTLIRGVESPTFVVDRGNANLAKGGTGDLLSGILASNFAQKLSPIQAIPFGVYAHGRAAELLSERIGNERSALVTEIADSLDAVFGELEGERTN